MNYREGEDSGTYFRTERFYSVNGQWFFTTREGHNAGPYDNHEEAEVELMMYIRHLNDASFTQEGDFVLA